MFCQKMISFSSKSPNLLYIQEISPQFFFLLVFPHVANFRYVANFRFLTLLRYGGIYLFGVLRRFQHCTGHITTGSWKGRGNQYIEFARVVYCKLLTNGKQLPAFPHKALTGIEPRPQRWEAIVLPPWPPQVWRKAVHYHVLNTAECSLKFTYHPCSTFGGYAVNEQTYKQANRLGHIFCKNVTKVITVHLDIIAGLYSL